MYQEQKQPGAEKDDQAAACLDLLPTHYPWEREKKRGPYGHMEIGTGHHQIHLNGPNAKCKDALSWLGYETKTHAEIGQVLFEAGDKEKRVGLGIYANFNAGLDVCGSFDAGQGILDVIDYYDREPNAFAQGTYTGAGTYAVAFNDKPGERVPKAGAYAEAGVGRARAEFSVFEAEARGPNASAGAHADVLGVVAMAKAEIAGASASAGPLGVKVGLGVDTGVRVGVRLGVDGLELKVLGTGFNIGKKPNLSILGNEISCCLL